MTKTSENKNSQLWKKTVDTLKLEEEILSLKHEVDELRQENSKSI